MARMDAQNGGAEEIAGGILRQVQELIPRPSRQFRA